MMDYLFKEDWFSHNIPNLQRIFANYKPKRILEIGSFEGRSTCFFVQEAKKYQDEVEIHCIDSWLGGAEHKERWDMSEVENRFDYNMQILLREYSDINLWKYKGLSHQSLMNIACKGLLNYFDFIYVDGSHEAPDVLLDALLAHKLARIGGCIAFDDYLWSPNKAPNHDHYLLVKPAVDHYINTYQRKVHVLQLMQIYQLYVEKLAD